LLNFEVIDYCKTLGLDDQINDLLLDVYVKEGFTDKLVAEKNFVISNLIKWGELILATSADGELVGMIICACPANLTKQTNSSVEVEMRLLAVSPLARGFNIGRSLCLAFEKKALSLGHDKLVLSTQPKMKSAHRLYESLGYQRNESRDWVSGAKQFLVYEKSM